MNPNIHRRTIPLAVVAGAIGLSFGCADGIVPTAPVLGDQPSLAPGGGGGGPPSVVTSITGLEPLFDAASNFSNALDVSDLGQIVGMSMSSTGGLLGVIWEGGTFPQALETEGSVDSRANAILPDGSVIVGNERTIAVRWVKLNGAFTKFVLPGQEPGVTDCRADDIGGDGTIAGTCSFGAGERAVVWRNGIMTDLGDGSVNAINANQQVLVGVGGEWFIWDLRTTPKTVTPIGSLGGIHTTAADINDLGHVVGGSQNTAGVIRPFLWTPKKGMVDLGTLGAGLRGQASAINNAGQIVGVSETPGVVFHATYWYKGKVYDLGVLSGYGSSVANGINPAGQIVGVSSTTVGSEHRATLWTVAK